MIKNDLQPIYSCNKATLKSCVPKWGAYLLWCSMLISPFYSMSNTHEEASNLIIDSDLREKPDVDKRQEWVAYGVIVDEAGKPLSGVSIREKGQNKETHSDSSGQFKIKISIPNAVLVFSSVGYAETEHISDRKEMKVVMYTKASELEEVFVVGYGKTNRKLNVASVSSVNIADIKELPITNMTQGLAGRSPGVLVQGSGGGVNKRNTISIRGGGEPLVVIDGIIRSYDDFVNLSPQDIDQFSVLKDASATAVYGSRATNGILQITTKKGKVGKVSFEYAFNRSYSQPEIWPSKLDAVERAQYANIAREYDGLEKQYSEEIIEKIKNGTDLLSYSNTDWRKLVLRDFAPQSKHSMIFSGGNEQQKFFMSLGHLSQESLYKTNTHNMKRTNILLNESVTVPTIGLTTIASIDAYLQKSKHPFTSSASTYSTIFSHVQNKSPLYPGVNALGLPYNIADNPVAETASDAGYLKNDIAQVSANLTLLWNIPKVENLVFRTSGNYRYLNRKDKNWRKDAGQYDWNSTTPQYLDLPTLQVNRINENSYTLQYFLEYNKDLGAHNISLLSGYEMTYGFSDNYQLRREKFPFHIDQIGVGNVATQTNGGTEAEYGRAGWVSQVKYNYLERYVFEGSLRYDGSDNFPKNRRWGAFYSGALGWNISEENFFKSLAESGKINLLKARASYGKIGLDNWERGSPFAIGRFEYLTSYIYNPKGYVINGTYAPGFAEGNPPSDLISWFTTDQFDLGFELAALSNKLYASTNYFYYKTKGFLYAPNPLEVGYTAPLGQALAKVSTDGEHRRAGVELQLGWKDRVRDFSYDISFNIVKFDQLWANKPDEIESSLLNPFTRITQQTGFYGNLYESLGYYKDEMDVLNSVKRPGSYNITGGDLKYNDFNGDGKIDAADQIRLGKNSFPRANYGMNLKLGYKGVQLGVLLQGATRFDMYLGDANRMNSGQLAGMAVIYDYQKDYWTPQNTDSRYPRLTSNSGLNGGNNYVGSDFWLINGAYLRLKDVNIGYDFGALISKKIKPISSIYLSFVAQNVFTISEATKFGLDPENSSTEGYGYPNERVLGLNLSIKF